MFINTESTPNPASLKFLPGRSIMEDGTANFSSLDEARFSPLAQRLFEIEGVRGVFIGVDFVTVTKSDNTDWPTLKPAILGTLAQHLLSGEPVVHKQLMNSGKAEQDNAIIHRICELLDTRVRPAVARDGGDIIFRDFRNGVVYLHLRGSCSGCPSSTITLKNGVEDLLRRHIPEVLAVRPVD